MRGCIYKRGKTYTIVFDVYDGDRRKQKSKGGFKTRSDAEFYLNRYINQVYNDKINFTLLSDYLNKWLESYKSQIAPNTYLGYKVNINHINNLIGKIYLSDLTVDIIQSAYNDLSKTLSNTSIIYIHRVLKNALNYAVRNKLISFNPCNDVIVPRKIKYNSSVLSEDDSKRLISILENCNYELYKAVMLALCCGLRRGECLGLKLSDIDFKNNIIMISRNVSYNKNIPVESDLKTSYSFRSILVSADFLKCININTCQPYICNITQHQLQKQFHKVLIDNNLPVIRFHDLRHTNATLLLKHGVPAKIVSSRLGHSSIGVTMDIYSHVLIDMQSEASAALDCLL